MEYAVSHLTRGQHSTETQHTRSQLRLARMYTRAPRPARASSATATATATAPTQGTHRILSPLPSPSSSARVSECASSPTFIYISADACGSARGASQYGSMNCRSGARGAGGGGGSWGLSSSPRGGERDSLLRTKIHNGGSWASPAGMRREAPRALPQASADM